MKRGNWRRRELTSVRMIRNVSGRISVVVVVPVLYNLSAVFRIFAKRKVLLSMNQITTTIREAITAIKTAVLQSQYRAAKVVNREQLALYFGIGRYISDHSRKGHWGTNAIGTISEQLQKELPGLRGFSARNLKNMRTFFEEWQGFFLSAAVAAELEVGTQSLPSTNDNGLIDCGLLLHSNRQTKVLSSSLSKDTTIRWASLPTSRPKMYGKRFRLKRNCGK